ncbi:hypothetical protein BBP40_004236 [Aspergillus hancockii]|nr:hypothetical protein BBP40_004236 [Aspergillus hancockii]
MGSMHLEPCPAEYECNNCICRNKFLGPEGLKATGEACGTDFKGVFKEYYLLGKNCPNEFLEKYTKMENNIRDYIYPKDYGFAGEPTPTVVQPGSTASPLLLDRFGSATGSYFSPKGDRYGLRAAPPSNLRVCQCSNYHVYQVQKAFPAWYGKIAGHFGQDGGG